MINSYEAPKLTLTALSSSDVISTSEGINLPEVPLTVSDDSW